MDTHGDAFQIQFMNRTYTDRSQAGDALNHLAAQAAGSSCEKQIGEFAGFKLILRAGFLDRVDILLKGKNSYTANISDNGLGTIRSIEYAIQNLDESEKRCGNEISEAKRRKSELESKIGHAFEHEQKLQTLSVRQQEIVKALDITKNQAANTQDSVNLQDESPSVSSIVENCQETEQPIMRRAVAVQV